MSGHTPGPLPKTLEHHTGLDYVTLMTPEQGTDDPAAHVYGDNAAAIAAEIVRRWNAHADLVAALREAQGSLAAVAGLLATYPRPSNDPHGRTLLDSMEHAKAASHAARAAIAKAGGA